MKDKYRELFEDVHLSKSAINGIKERADELQNEKSRKVSRHGSGRQQPCSELC